MLYIDGKRLEQAGEYWQNKYKEVVDRLWKASRSKGNFVVSFKVAPTKVSTQYLDNGMQVHTVGSERVRLERTIDMVDENGRRRKVHFAYSEEPLPESDGKADFKGFMGGKWMFGENNLVETIDDEELAFFLYFVHPRFGDDRSKAPFMLIDERSDAEKKVETQEDEVEFKYFLYSKSSPLRQDESKLRTIARAWGVEDVADKDVPLLLTKIEESVMAGERAKKLGKNHARGIREFLEDTNLGEMVEIMSIIQLAHEDGLIGLNTRPNQMGVYWFNENGDPAGKIIGLTGKTLDNWRVRLADHLMGNRGILNSIKYELGMEVDLSSGEDTGQIDYYDLLNNFFADDYKSQVNSICKYYGIRTAGVKKELWREKLLDVLKDEGLIEQDFVPED